MTFDEFLAKHNVQCEVPDGVESGWWPILEDCFDGMYADGWDGKCSQIKEKFGELRIYGCHDYPAPVEIAEEESKHTCEICGKRGKVRNIGGWFKALCKEHGPQYEGVPVKRGV